MPADLPQNEPAMHVGGAHPVTARAAACAVLDAHAERYPDLLPQEPDITLLEDRDAALAQTLCTQTLLRWRTLQYLLEAALSRPFSSIQKSLHAPMLLGAAQMLLLDRVPLHAAIHASVELAKHRSGKPAAGLVNAGLRQLARLVHEEADRATDSTMLMPVKLPAWTQEGDQVPLAGGKALRLLRPVLPEDKRERWAAALGVPDALLARWAEDLGLEGARGAALHVLAHPPVCLAGPGVAGLAPEMARPHTPGGFTGVYTGESAGLSAFLRSRADVWVQDPASTHAVRSVSDLTPKVVIDLCAGQGTKTRQLSWAFPNATVIACDPDAPRVRALREVEAARENVRVLEHRAVIEAFAGKADLVLLDVPCSNTGVLPRRPEAIHRVLTDQLTRLVPLQRRILADGAALLAPGGTLLYSTCSIDHAENREQAAWATANLPLDLLAQEQRLPLGLAGDDPLRYADGAFSARFVRRASS